MNYKKLIFTLLITFISAINCAEEANPWAGFCYNKMTKLKTNNPALLKNPLFAASYRQKQDSRNTRQRENKTILQRTIGNVKHRIRYYMVLLNKAEVAKSRSRELIQQIEENRKSLEKLQESKDSSLKPLKAPTVGRTKVKREPSPTDSVVIHAKPIGARMLKPALASYYAETNIAADEMDESDDRDLLPFKKEIKRCQTEAAARAKVEEARKLQAAIEATKVAEIEQAFLREKARNAKREAIMRKESDEYVRTHPQVDPDDLDEIEARFFGSISPGYIRQRTRLETMNSGIKVRLFTDKPYRFCK